MIFILLAVVLSESDICFNLGKTNCLKCVDTDGCGYCRSSKKEDHNCFSVNSTDFTTCEDGSGIRDAKCVAELGGDASQNRRYIIGGTFIIFSILVDLSCRFLYKKPKPQAFLKPMITTE